MNTIDLELYKIFYYTAKAGSLTKASKILEMPKSKISKDLTKLEQLLEFKFLNRSPRGVSLTNEGNYLFKHIQSSIEKLVEGPSFLENNDGVLKGVIKLTASEDISETILINAIKDFQNLHPKIKVELYSSTEIIDINKSNIDVALRIGKLKDSSLIQKKISDIKVKYYASSTYLKKYQTINSLKDLSNHKLATIRTLEGPIVQKLTFNENSIRFLSNSMVLLKKMALTEDYIVTLPEFYCREEISKAKLKNILPNDFYFKGSLYILSRPSRYIPKHVQVFKSFIESVVLSSM